MNESSVDLKAFIIKLFQQKFIILGSVALFLLLAVLANLLIPTRYEAQVVLQARNVSNPFLPTLAKIGFAIENRNFNVNTHIEMIKSSSLLKGFLNDNQLQIDIEGFRKHYLTVKPIRNTDLFTLEVKASTAEEAVRWANSLSMRYVQDDIIRLKQDNAVSDALIREQFVSQIEDVETSILKRSETLGKEDSLISLMVMKRIVRDSYSELVLAQPWNNSRIVIVSPATEPQTAVQPKKILNLVIAGILGIVAGICAALFRIYWQGTNR